MTLSARQVHSVLFVCHHGAAKSVLAGTYFNTLAAESGLAARAIARGTEPDPEIAAVVRQKLGAELCVDRPRLLTASDVAAADLLVAFDLGAADLGTAPDLAWDALPPVSDDFERAQAQIVARVTALVAELKSRSNPGGT